MSILKKYSNKYKNNIINQKCLKIYENIHKYMMITKGKKNCSKIIFYIQYQ